MCRSGVFAGVFDLDLRPIAAQDLDGKTIGEELERIGYRRRASPAARTSSARISRLHIEQGPILEAEDKTIGVVTGVQGMRWYEVTVTGQESHAGPTPMPRRQDALVGAARMVAGGQRHRPRAIAPAVPAPPWACSSASRTAAT